MNEVEILKGIKKYFNIKEFVGSFTYKIHGERAWKFFDFRLLETILILRIHIGRKIFINDWYKGGKFSQRGLRTILQQLVKNFFYKNKLYLSGHLLGKSIDFDVEGMTAEEVRNWIEKNRYLFPYKIRLEHNKNGKPIPWVHLDIIYELKNKFIYFFNV